MGARFLEVSGDLLLYLMLFGMLVTMYFGALKRKRNVVICNIPMLPCAIGSVVSFIEVSHKPYAAIAVILVYIFTLFYALHWLDIVVFDKTELKRLWAEWRPRRAIC